MRIAVDVMGGDHGCNVVVEGAVQALHHSQDITAIILVGDEAQIRAALASSPSPDDRVQVVHASEVLTMEDKPVLGLRRKKDCSILRAVDLLKDKRADALVSPGNTGGVVAASTIRLRPLAGVERPGIAAVIPAPENEFVLLDAGANVDSKPMHLAQYAVMGSVLSREILGYKKPRVGILSVGTEDVKGNELTLETFKLCRQLNLNFIGNVEGHDLFSNRVDVVVCDGFVGNVVLKTCENLATEIFAWLKRELMKSFIRKAGAYLAKDAFRTIKRRVDPDTYGGAPLLGLNGNVMIAHGSASARAIQNAIHISSRSVHMQINQVISRELAEAEQRLASIPAASSSPASP